MSLKVKLTSAALAFVMVISILIVGVFSAKSASLNVGGSIVFNATGINATISTGVLENCSFVNSGDEGTKLKSITIDTTRSQEELEGSSEFQSWSGLALQFDETDTFPFVAKIKFTVTNNSSDVKENILFSSTTTGQSDGITTTVSPNSVTIGAGDSQECEIVFTLNEDVDQELNFNISLNLERSAINAYLATIMINHDATGPISEYAGWHINTVLNGVATTLPVTPYNAEVEIFEVYAEKVVFYAGSGDSETIISMLKEDDVLKPYAPAIGFFNVKVSNGEEFEVNIPSQLTKEIVLTEDLTITIG